MDKSKNIITVQMSPDEYELFAQFKKGEVTARLTNSSGNSWSSFKEIKILKGDEVIREFKSMFAQREDQLMDEIKLLKDKLNSKWWQIWKIK